eukprot:gene21011-43331_t
MFIAEMAASIWSVPAQRVERWRLRLCVVAVATLVAACVPLALATCAADRLVVAEMYAGRYGECVAVEGVVGVSAAAGFAVWVAGGARPAIAGIARLRVAVWASRRQRAVFVAGLGWLGVYLGVRGLVAALRWGRPAWEAAGLLCFSAFMLFIVVSALVHPGQ